jgi:hypothetical protein
MCNTFYQKYFILSIKERISAKRRANMLSERLLKRLVHQMDWDFVDMY